MIDLKNTVLGIELGSTRIKAVLIDRKHTPIASGDFEWENQLVNGIWTYPMDLVCKGLQTCFARLKGHIKEGYDADIVIFDPETIGSDATITDPIKEPTGIEYVFIGGVMRLKKGKIL